MLAVLPSAELRRCLALARKYHDPGRRVSRNIVGAYGMTHEQFILNIASAYLRHKHTDYDSLLRNGFPKEAARTAVQPEINRILNQWRQLP